MEHCKGPTRSCSSAPSYMTKAIDRLQPHRDSLATVSSSSPSSPDKCRTATTVPVSGWIGGRKAFLLFPQLRTRPFLPEMSANCLQHACDRRFMRVQTPFHFNLCSGSKAAVAVSRGPMRVMSASGSYCCPLRQGQNNPVLARCGIGRPAASSAPGKCRP
jgi:hypothetical protein